ncbi:MAG: hypothetical protein VW840_14580 [Gammaproteobacteria bacterium]
MTFRFPLLNDDSDSNPQLTSEQQAIMAERIDHLVTLGVQKGVAPGDAIGLSTTYFDGLYELATRYYRQQNYEAAIPLYTKLIMMKPYDLDYYKGLGACYLGKECYAESIAAYRAGQFLGATDAELHYYMGLAHYFKREFVVAFELIRFARVLDEKDPGSKGKIADFATQILERIHPLVPPGMASNMDLRPE